DDLQRELVHMRAAQMHRAGGVRDPQIEGAAPAAEALQQRLTASQENAFHVSLYLSVCTPSAADLEVASARVEAAGRSALCQLAPATFRQLDGRLATLPLARDPIGRRPGLGTSAPAPKFPLFDFATMLRGGIYVRISIDDEGYGKGIARHLKVARSLARERRKHEELLQDGKYIGQHRVFGYRWDGGLVIVEDEGELIREAVHRVLNGEALNAICRDWNQRGIRTVEGNTWGQRSLKRVLVSGRISGRRDYGIAPGGGRLAIPRIVTEGDWPAIVDPELSDKVRALLASNSRPSAPRRHLLTGGLTRCALCGA